MRVGEAALAGNSTLIVEITRATEAAAPPLDGRRSDERAGEATDSNAHVRETENLSELAELERSLRLRDGIEPSPIETPHGTFDPLSAERLWECHTQFGAYENHRVLAIGRIERHKPLSHAAAKILKTETGIGARFELGRDIAYGIPLIVGVITTTAEHTRQLLDMTRVDGVAAVIARVHVTRPKGHWKGFPPVADGDSQSVPFAFVVEAVLEDVPETY